MPELPDHNLNPPEEPECPMCGDLCPWFTRRTEEPGPGDVCFSEDRGWDESGAVDEQGQD